MQKLKGGKNNQMAKKKKTLKDLQKELKKRQVVESVNKQQVQKYQQRKALEKQVKELRFKQSKFGRTVTTGKAIFGRIGAVTKGIGKGFERTTQNVGKSQQAISKPQKALIGNAMLGKPAKKKKPFNIDDVLSRMPQ